MYIDVFIISCTVIFKFIWKGYLGLWKRGLYSYFIAFFVWSLMSSPLNKPLPPTPLWALMLFYLSKQLSKHLRLNSIKTSFDNCADVHTQIHFHLTNTWLIKKLFREKFNLTNFTIVEFLATSSIVSYSYKSEILM